MRIPSKQRNGQEYEAKLYREVVGYGECSNHIQAIGSVCIQWTMKAQLIVHATITSNRVVEPRAGFQTAKQIPVFGDFTKYNYLWL